MSKSYVLFSIALGGLALAGCNKDPEPTPTPVPPATQPALPTTIPVGPTTLIVPPMPALTLPTTGAAGDLIDKGKADAGAAEKKVDEIIGGLKGPTSLPSDATK